MGEIADSMINSRFLSQIIGEMDVIHMDKEYLRDGM